ncbi:hypothetical protein MASR2M66_28950 [Chloroflexota bacterium]
MNPDELNTLIQLKEPEGLKIDFKAKFYDINNSDNNIKERQWNELVKDILALANGNIGTVGQYGYLIIGIADKINSSGTRDVFDVTEIPVNQKQVLDKVNSFSKSQLPDLDIEPMLFQGKTIQIIKIPPTPYLYETSKPLVTSKTTYHENSVFIRRRDGIGLASTEERETILAEKKFSHFPIATQITADDKKDQSPKEHSQNILIRYGYDGQELHDLLELEAITSEAIYAIQNKTEVNFEVELTELTLLDQQLQKIVKENPSPQERISKVEILNRIQHLQKVKTIIQQALIVVTSKPIFEHCASPQYLGLCFRGLGSLLLEDVNRNRDKHILSLDLWYFENSRISTVIYVDLAKLNRAEELEELMSYYLSHKWDIFALPSITTTYEVAIPAIIIEYLNQIEIKEFDNLEDTLNVYKWKVGLH